MELSTSRKPYIIPSYSLTGDLLAYLKCGLQYRYHNRGALPPSKPVQLWFGEFIHAVMEEAYLRWAAGEAPGTFPWNWEEHIRPIELTIARRLARRGLVPPYRVFCPWDPARLPACDDPDCKQANHKLIASRRAEAAINTWGPHLFPLIAVPEVRLQGIRRLLGEKVRAPYYEVTGIVDVLASVKLAQADPDNLIIRYLREVPEIRTFLDAPGTSSFELIVDYKGTRRPGFRSDSWKHFEWQVSTYAWLRQRMPDASPVVAGIVLFLNELEMSVEEFEELQQDVREGTTDVMPAGEERDRILGWRSGLPLPEVSAQFRERRSIRVITVDDERIQASLAEFDQVVHDIEAAVLMESAGHGIIASWSARQSGRSYTAPESRTCTVCDFRYFCPLSLKINVGGPPTS